jgi:ERF superfamily protein
VQRSSPSIGNLAAALAKAQPELINPEKSLSATIRSEAAGGAEQSFRYAPLSSGLEIVRKTLGLHEIATMQTTSIDQAAGIVNLTTVLAHASGEWIASDWPVCAIGETTTPHRMGAALTYARRYALFTLVGIAGEDDLDAPDLTTPTNRTSGPETPEATGNGRLNGGHSHRRRLNDPKAAKPILGTEASAQLRNRLLAELNDLGGRDDAAIWAHRCLSEKNTLSAPDALRVEEAFQAKLATLAAPPEVPHPAAPHTRNERSAVTPKTRLRSKAVDKSLLALPEPRRVRDRDHVRSVAKHPCLICGRQPSDAHHLRLAQSRALGRKASDEFTVPLCRGHHREVHRYGDEAAWWKKAGIDPTVTARGLWLETHPLPATSGKMRITGTTRVAPVGADQSNAKRGRSVSKRSMIYKTKPIIAAGHQ